MGNLENSMVVNLNKGLRESNAPADPDFHCDGCGKGLYSMSNEYTIKNGVIKCEDCQE